MSRERIRNLNTQLETYLDSDNAIEPFVYLFAKKKEGEEEYIAKDIVLNNQGDTNAAIELIRKYSSSVQNYVDGDHDFNELEEDEDGELWFKKMRQEELDLLSNLEGLSDPQISYQDFIKSKYYRRCLVLEVRINEEGTQKILLFKQLKGSKYNARRKFFVFTPFETQTHIKLVNNNRDIILNDKFEFAAFLDADDLETSFFFITDRNLFEDMFNYHRIYENAYADLTRRLDFIDWSESGSPTKPTLRQGYSLSRFARLEECIESLKADLRSPQENLTKRAFEKRNIVFTVEDGTISIAPEGTQQIRALLKIIRDGGVRTNLLGREGIAGDFEEI